MYHYAIVEENARLYNKAQVFDWARVGGCTEVHGNSFVAEHAIVFENVKIYGNVEISGNSRVSGNSIICDKAIVTGLSQVLEDVIVFGESCINSCEVSGTTRVYSGYHINKKFCDVDVTGLNLMRPPRS